MHTDKEFLSNVSIFHDLEPSELDKMILILHERNIPESTVIMNEGEEGDTMYVMKEGTVEISSQITLKTGTDKWSESEKSMAVLDHTRLNFFGEMALITGLPRSATIRTLSKCIVYEIKKTHFEKITSENPAIGYKVIHAISIGLCERLRQQNLSLLKITTALSIAISKKKTR